VEFGVDTVIGGLLAGCNTHAQSLVHTEENETKLKCQKEGIK